MNINLKPASGRNGMNRSIWTLAWPAIIEFGLQTVVQYIDLLMVSGLGNQATAIVGIVTQSQFLIKFPLSNMSIGVLAYVSRAMGERNQEKV
jgi:Na+-driven multidrug efflux pump